MWDFSSGAILFHNLVKEFLEALYPTLIMMSALIGLFQLLCSLLLRILKACDVLGGGVCDMILKAPHTSLGS